MNNVVSNANDMKISNTPLSRVQIAFDAIASGASVEAAAESIGIRKSRLYNWIEANEDLKARYQAAQLAKATKRFKGD